MSELNILEENRPWGSFRRFTNNQKSTVKLIFVNPNEELSLQSHNKRSEFWRVIKGNGIFLVDDLKKDVMYGDEQEIPLGAKHRMIGGPDGMEVLEISLGDFDENDIIRYEDKYNRI